jgi:hypothetical protein
MVKMIVRQKFIERKVSIILFEKFSGHASSRPVREALPDAIMLLEPPPKEMKRNMKNNFF